MSTPIAQGAEFQEPEFQEPDLDAGSTETASASEDTPALGLSPHFDGGAPSPDAEPAIVVDDGPAKVALAQFNDAV